jgi:Tol biopolymer transport system component
MLNAELRTEAEPRSSFSLLNSAFCILHFAFSPAPLTRARVLRITKKMRTIDGGLLQPGLDVSRYRIDSLIAIGGMSEVYAAHDTALRRRVALKVLRGGGERVARFVREAEAASSLNHPVMVPVYDSGSAVVGGETIHYLAMEMVEGETLTVWAKSTRDWRRKVLALADVAEGLSRAHARGIVHRDLKPDNLMVSRSGHPKILDFGIATLTQQPANRDGDTAPDAVLGTAAYMAPEQAEHRALDHRCDVFAFGAVLYEVVTGTAAFRRATTVDTMHAVVHEQPSLDGLDPALARVLRRCLAKVPEERYDSMHDVALDLREIARSANESTPGRRSLRRLGAALLAAVVIAVLAIGVRRSLEGVPAPPTVVAAPQSTITMQRVTNNGKSFNGSISRDGRYVVYAAGEGVMQTLWLKQLATGTSARLVGPAEVSYTGTAFSPDSAYVYYSQGTLKEPNVFDLYRVATIGGQPEKIADDMEGYFALSPDGKRVMFRRFNALIRDAVLFVASTERKSERELLRKHYPEGIVPMSWLPGGREVAFGYISPNPRDSLRVVAMDVDSGAQRRIDLIQWRRIAGWRGMGSSAWLADGSGLVATVAAQRMPPQIWWAPTGGVPRKITSDISEYFNISVTDDGKTILAGRIEATSNIWLASIPEKKATALTVGTGNRFGFGGVTWSGREVLFTTTGKDHPGLSAVTADGTTRVLSDALVHWMPNMSQDGSRMTFVSDSSGPIEIWVADRNGENAVQVTHAGRSASPQFLPDGKSLVFIWAMRDQTLWRTSLDGREQVQLTHTPPTAPAISRDGRWILCRLRSKEANGPLWRTVILSSDGKQVRDLPLPRYGNGPLFGWFPDGRIAYVDYLDGVANVWSAEQDGSDPRKLTHFDAGHIYAFAPSPDGQSVAIARGDPVSDLVLIRDFR